jgi:hypothetical protein
VFLAQVRGESPDLEAHVWGVLGVRAAAKHQQETAETAQRRRVIIMGSFSIKVVGTTTGLPGSR